VREYYPALYSGDGESERELIIMPAFSQFGTGVVFNARNREVLGPVLARGCAELAAARVYLLDGTFLGVLRDLSALEDRRK
jgi:hypothetical protein